ncbi:hypothetical protein IJ103_02245 [Candidatus Saccharibacteria bacterium]|nr:hypothetical protein [Candidatus Saccharibacteria bacterium]MBQ9017040.1 hypothetical protein [Candidatus Saccharibacteria bacterium]
MAEEKVNPAETEGPAIEKRVAISKSQKQILFTIGGTAVFVGVCIVLISYFLRLIGFNSKVIDAKDSAISNYSTTIKNVGVCKVSGTGVITDEELKKCTPNAYSSDSLAGTLRYNVMVQTASNKDLESVARELQSSCYDENKQKIDFKSLYDKAEEEAEKDPSKSAEDLKAQYLNMMKSCSALRAIPDALPAQKNTEALLASLNRLFDIAGWVPSGLSPDSSSSKSPYDGVLALPVSLSIEANSVETLKVLSTIENSIRTFDITSATIEWSGDDVLKLSSLARAYYTTEESLTTRTVTVFADPSKRTTSKKTGATK